MVSSRWCSEWSTLFVVSMLFCYVLNGLLNHLLFSGFGLVEYFFWGLGEYNVVVFSSK